MGLVEDFESGPHKAVAFQVERAPGMAGAKNCQKLHQDTVRRRKVEEGREEEAEDHELMKAIIAPESCVCRPRHEGKGRFLSVDLSSWLGRWIGWKEPRLA